MELEEMLERPPNPKKKANLCSTITFWWMVPIFRRCYKNALNTQDLYETLESQKSDKKGDILEAAWEQEKASAKKLGKQPSLTNVLVKVFGPSIFCYGLRFAFVELFVRMLQPIALGQLILYYSSTSCQEQESYHHYIAAFYSSVIILSSLCSTIIYYPTLLATFHTSLKLKIACASLIYRKALKLHKTTLQVVTVGHIVNLLSGDLNTMDLICYFCHNLWIGPLVTVIATTLMYQEIGVYAFLGVALILATIPFQGWLSKVYATLKRKGAANTDQRLELMHEIINGIQVIKMYAWEPAFTKMVSIIRRNEILLVRYALFIKGMHVAFSLFRTRTAVFVCILAYVLSGNVLTARKAFVVYACFNAMRHTMTDFFTFAIEQAVVANVSLKRIETFLLQPEIEMIERAMEDDDDCKRVVHLKNISAKWNPNKADFCISNIQLEVNSSGLYAIIGPVGSGKSTLFQCILNEITPSQGQIDIRGTISYASQEPWLYSSTIQQNILFGSPLNQYRYNEVLRICSLTNDMSKLPYGDRTLVGDRGAALSGGQKIRVNLARAIYKDADIYLLDDPFSALDSKVANDIFDNCIHSFLKDKICLLITHQHQFLKRASKIILMSHGTVKVQGTYDTMEADIWNFTHFKTDELLMVDNTKEKDDNEQVVYGYATKEDVSPKIVQESRNSGRVTWDIYQEYFKACGNKCGVLFVFALFVLAQIFASSGDYFLKYWVNMEQIGQTNLTRNETTSHNGAMSYMREFCIYTYTVITITTVIVTIASSFMFYISSTRGALHLHESMFGSVLQATMRFFHTNPGGRILNRFSKDIETIDITMPYAMLNCIQTLLSILGVVIIVSIVNPWLIVPTTAAFCVINVLRTYYLTVSSNIKRLECTTRSPVLSYVSTSLQGLTTIRAYNAQSRLQKEFDSTQDVHTTARFLNIAACRMFAVWLEIICAVYLALVVFSFLIFTNDYGGNVGLAITQVMGMMGSIQWGVRQSSELENLLTSVERIVEYRDLGEKEKISGLTKPSSDWPQKGRIDFVDVCLSYAPNEPPILKHLKFSIEPQQKIGIIGRTGSGKSSIINALFQLAPTKGSIFIDDIYISKMNLHVLRSNISIIPQEPVLFTGSIRNNLDPYNEFQDHVLWNILKEVRLDKIVHLDTKITENASNLSVGQKQLICLARAIVRNNKILILDEATANIDPETDHLIQKTIQEKFQQCTVLTVAHRLENIVNSDKILIMDDGHLIDFQHPYLLLQNNNNNYLSRMLEEAGDIVTTRFVKTAKQNYESNT